MIDLSPDAWALRVSHSVPQLKNLTPIRFSFGFNQQLIRVVIESTSAQFRTVNPNWRRGGFINQFYNGYELDSKRVPLNRPKILIFNNMGQGSYQLEFRPVGLYLPNYKLNIFEYRYDEPQGLTTDGITGDTAGLLDALDERLDALPQDLAQTFEVLLDAGETP